MTKLIPIMNDSLESNLGFLVLLLWVCCCPSKKNKVDMEISFLHLTVNLDLHFIMSTLRGNSGHLQMGYFILSAGMALYCI